MRSSSIEFWKKTHSAFMPNRLIVWNELFRVSNPTKFTPPNDLIRSDGLKINYDPVLGVM